MWKATLSAYDGDRYRTGRHRAGRPGRRRWGPHLLVQWVRGALLGTSATQLYRLLDQTNYEKSVDQLISLLQILDCDVELVVRAKSA